MSNTPSSDTPESTPRPESDAENSSPAEPKIDEQPIDEEKLQADLETAVRKVRSKRGDMVGGKIFKIKLTPELWKLMGCNLLVFVTSVCIMVLELTATRLIAKHVGSTLYTWTSVIGVVLAGITIGNYLGGWMADRFGAKQILRWLFLASSLLCFFVLLLDQIVSGQQRPDGWDQSTYILLIVTEMFLLPSIALGTISPAVASIALSTGQKTGITVGNVYAWGAMGSIVGTFMAGFVLIDIFGTRVIVVQTAVVLAVMGLIVSFGKRLYQTMVGAGWLQLVLVMALICTSTSNGAGYCGAVWGSLVGWESDRGVLEMLDSETRQGLLRRYHQKVAHRLTMPTSNTLTEWIETQDKVAVADPTEDRPDINLKDEFIKGATRARLELSLLITIHNELDRRSWLDTLVWIDDEIPEASSMAAWAKLGTRLGESLHEIGLLLNLRGDRIGEYHDESNYSYINIYEGTDSLGDDTVKVLKLDKLIHSYFNPADPTRLHYDYELIYAGITELAASRASTEERMDVSARQFGDDIYQRLKAASQANALPDGVTLDSDRGELVIRGAFSDQQRLAVLKTLDSGAYLAAVERLVILSNAPDNFGTGAETPLDVDPQISQKVSESTMVQYMPNGKLLRSFRELTDKDVEQLVYVAKNLEPKFYRELQDLQRKTRRLSTLFVGGGGFIFPRWVEKNFPGSDRIDVVEIDPDVKLAVQSHLGLPSDDRTNITTHIADGRMFVRDQIRRNEQSTPVKYNFIYGDAFNDYAVPWHLTTVEYAREVKQLLHEDGLYLANIIDMFPRTVYPARKRNKGTVPYRGQFPPAVAAEAISHVRDNAPISLFRGMRIEHDNLGFLLNWDGRMTPRKATELKVAAGNFPDFHDAINSLYDMCNTPVAFEGELPQQLMIGITGNEGWQRCEAPFDALEVMRVEQGDVEVRDGFAIGCRGRMSDSLQEQLLGLAANNEEFEEVVMDLYKRSRHEDRGGKFLARFVNTVGEVFPNVYVFAAVRTGMPHDTRETFVVACSDGPVDFREINLYGNHWSGQPFATWETGADGDRHSSGQMQTLLELAEGKLLTDDFAPVDRLLKPVFESYEN